jgi:integrase/recombinase XerD
VLSIYRRHRAQCKFAADRSSKKCRCALWITGTLFGEAYRKSAETRSWEAAEKIKRTIEDGNHQEQPKSITIKDALDAFIADCESRSLNPSTLRKYRLLHNHVAAFAHKHGLRGVSELDTGTTRRFREQRVLSPRTASKELQRIRAFFNFSIENGWIEKNPARAIKSPEIRPNPTLPFSDSEVSKLLGNADFRTRLFFRVLLHSGLRIIDAAQLRPERIEHGKLFLYQQKTGIPVRVPLPPDLIADLAKQPTTGGFYFAVASDNPISIAEYYRQKLTKAGKAAGVANARPHRFRDTFAVRLLEKGVPLETVSTLLGHTDIKTTQRSYAPWVQSLQDNLEIAVAKTWQPALVRVK